MKNGLVDNEVGRVTVGQAMQKFPVTSWQSSFFGGYFTTRIHHFA